MEIFKIISDPYKKEIKFETVVTETWETIPVTRNDNSNLVSDELVHGFFPYNVKKIIDEIYEMKHKQGQRIEIMFEGTADDYNALRNLCSREKYADKIKLLAQKKYLNSAKDILPKISDIFKNVKPLIDDTIFSDEKFKADMQKLEDTVNRQMVPICVIGNYSSGKSTFVNALIGREILPSGDDPVTDCVYRITCSPDKECGWVQFEYKGKTVRFLINSENNDGFVSYGQSISDDKFLSGLKEKLAFCSSKSVHFRIHTLLFMIEEHKKQTKNHDTKSDISSLIQICIPFSKEGVLSESKCDYVIFDTPGESSASNEYHSDVLQKQMQSLSNGLVLFITDSRSLDKVSEENLCRKLISMDSIDERFTMVIVNRADSANLPKDGFEDSDIEEKLGQAVCSTLHSNRIFYVSSILGLASKQNGKFIDEYYQNVYDKEIRNYTDSNARTVKSLYRYNIIPEQIKENCDEMSEAQPNKLFAKSGLFWIEQEIKQFAEEYSPYDKCIRSKAFLEEIIEKTLSLTKEKQKKFEASKAELDKKLKEEAKKNIDYLQDTAVSFWDKCKKDYLLKMAEKEKFTEIEQSEFQKWHDDLQSYFQSYYKGYNFWKDAKAKNFKERVDNKKKLKELSKEIETIVSDRIFKKVKEKFDNEIYDYNNILYHTSKVSLIDISEKLKKELIDAITCSEGLSDEKKRELERIVANYERLQFQEKADTAFDINNLKQYKFKIGNLKIGEKDSLNLKKLTSTYNREMKKNIDDIADGLEKNHIPAFAQWKNRLLQLLEDNIVEINPDLRELNAEVNAQKKEIEDLKDKGLRLREYKNQIESLMKWR